MINNYSKIYHIYEIIFNLNSKNKSLFEKSELNFRNYQDFIINRVEKDFSPIINSNNISDKFQNIIKLYEKMKLDKKNELLIRYKIFEQGKIN